MRLQGVNVAVTGAGRGIGLGIARRLAMEGASVVVGDVDEKAASAAAAELRAESMHAQACRVDVRDRASIRNLVAQTVEHFGSLDVMFNNAGINRPQHFLDVTEDVWHEVLDVNALGVMLGTQEAARQMIAQGRGGVIVNTASIASRESYPSFISYCVSKFAVLAIIQGAAKALAPYGIRVNGFAPGVVDTPLWSQLDHDLMSIGDSDKPGEAMRAFAAGILMGRPAVPEDIAGTAVYLASADSAYMTGQVVMIDGGMVLV